MPVEGATRTMMTELKPAEGGDPREVKPRYKKGGTRKSQAISNDLAMSLRTGLKVKESKGKERDKLPSVVKSPKRDRMGSHRKKSSVINPSTVPVNKPNGQYLSLKNGKEVHLGTPSPRSIKKRMMKYKSAQTKKDSIRQKGMKQKLKKSAMSDNSIENKKEKQKLKNSRSINDNNNEETNESNKNISDYSDTESVIENISIQNDTPKKEDILMVQSKILEKYRSVFAEYNRELLNIIKVEHVDSEHITSVNSTNNNSNSNRNQVRNQLSAGDSEGNEISRRTLDTIMRISLKCLDYHISILSVIFLLLHRLKNAEIELMDSEKENIEHILRIYANRFITSYKIVFKIHYKKAFKDNDLTKGKGPTQGGTMSKRDLFRHVRMKMKNQFLFNCEIILNLISCILHTVYVDDDRIYYIHLRGQLYKFISDITETGFKYKYEKLAKESYEEAMLLAHKCLKPTDLLYLNLVNNYIYFLYYVLAQEQEALDICIFAFDRATQILDQIPNQEDQDTCIQLLTKMRFNIKRWTKHVNKNSLLFLNF